MKKAFQSRARGSVMVYSVILLTVLLAVTSLAVDYAHVQMVKAEMQRAADSTAVGMMQWYARYGGGATGQLYANYIPSNAYAGNPTDGSSHINPTYSYAWGYWNTVTQSFVNTGNILTAPVAVQVTYSRTAANNNAVPLTFPLMNAKTVTRMTCNVTTTATAVDFGGQTASPTIGGQMDPWLSGMANGATASDQDTAPSQSPSLVMNVVPGTYITVTNVSGSVNHDPSLAKDPAGGNTGNIYSHMSDDLGAGTPVQNGIGDVIAPIDALLGVFLKSNSPDQNPAPTVVRDYSTQAARDLTQYNDIQAQQPFYIGTGKTSGGTVQTFRVPPGCTRLYMGPMDGHQWANNGGSFTATVTQSQDIQLVQ